MTLLLIAANLLLAFVLVWQPNLVDQFGFDAARPSFFSAVTGLFLHANLVHLLGNLVFLAAVGASLELATGHLRFVTVYFAGGFCGELAHWLAMRGADSAPLVGASGCIAGCAGYYALRYARLRVPLGPKLSAPVWTIALGWMALQVLGAMLRFGDGQAAVSYWSHLGGLIGGALLTFVFRAPDLEQARLDREALADLAGRGPSAEAVAAQRHLRRHPRDVGVWRQLVSALRVLGDHEDLALALARLYDLAEGSERGAILRELGGLGRMNLLPPAVRIEAARERAGDDPELAAALLESLPEEPDAVFGLGELFLERDPKRAKAAFERLLAEWPDHPTTRKARARGWIAASS